MKNLKKMLSALLALALLLTVFTVPTLEVNAATYGKVPSKVRIIPHTVTNSPITFDLADEKDKITNIKTSSKSLKAKQTYNYVYNSKTSPENNQKYAEIDVYATKQGKYTLTFDILKGNGKKRSTHKITVYAYDDVPLKALKINNKSYLDFDLLTGNSGKIKVTMNKGYKLKKLEYGVYNKDGSKMTYKKIKNGSKITFGKYFYKYDYDFTSTNSSFYYNYWTRGLMAPTKIRITYIDKYTKQENVTERTLNKWVG